MGRKTLLLPSTRTAVDVLNFRVIRLMAVFNFSQLLHRESKKQRHLTLAHTKYWPIFKILSLLDLVGNL